MITGDHPATATSVARELGLLASGRVVSGHDLEAMTDAELEDQVRALRTGRDRFSSWISKLADFYRGLVPLGETAPTSMADQFETWLNAIVPN